MEQKSHAWHAWRQQGIGASEAPIILGKSPYKNILQLYEEKTASVILEEPPNFAMERGNIIEPIARARHFFLTGIDFEPTLHVWQEWPVLRCSTDGSNMEHMRGLEIKYVGIKDWEAILEGKIPEKHFPQIQHQFICTGFKTIDYHAFYLPPSILKEKELWHRGESKIIECKPDMDFILDYVPKARAFWEHVEKRIPPEYTPKPRGRKRAAK